MTDIQGVAKKKNEIHIQVFIFRILINVSLNYKHLCIYQPFFYFWLNFQMKFIENAGAEAFQINFLNFLLDMSKK